MKPRIIIADTDENYIAPLQLKFAKELHDQVDLEIITQRAYFEELFSKPQKAEILVVSDDLYNPNLLLHNLDHIFLMQEQPNESQEVDMRVTSLFKYSSIVAIFNDILGKSLESLNNSISKKKETQIILVTSAAGGVGKTTIAMGIAANLTQNYKKVLYINAARLQTFQYRFKNPAVISAPEIYTSLLSKEAVSYEDINYAVRKELFYYLPAFKAALVSLGIEYSVYRKIAMTAKKNGDYDFIIIDAENTFDEEKLNLIDVADKIVIVTDQTLDGVRSTNFLLTNINGVNADNYIFICNKFKSNQYNALVEGKESLRFRVNEYIEAYAKEIDCEELSKKVGIKKTAFLIM